MKTLSLQVLFLAILGTCHSMSAASAGDFTGQWTGTGTMTTRTMGTGTPPTTTDCGSIEIDIDQQPDHITIQKYSASCGYTSSDWGPDVMTINNGKISEDGEEDGTFDGTTLLTNQPDMDVIYAFNLKLIVGSDGKPVLESYYGVKNYIGASVIEANLTKK